MASVDLNFSKNKGKSPQWGNCALRHRGRRGRESQCKARLAACLGGIAFCGQFLCFAFQSFRHRTAVFLDKVLHKKRSLSACLGALLVPLDISISVFHLPLSSGPLLNKCLRSEDHNCDGQREHTGVQLSHHLSPGPFSSSRPIQGLSHHLAPLRAFHFD